MRAMLNTMKTHLLQGENLVLVTVVASSGATPRGAGARMLVGPQGRITGTIGGGAVEYRSEQIAREVLAEGRSRNHQFSLTKDDVQNLGMICGGNVTVYFHYLPAGDREILALAQTAPHLIIAMSKSDLLPAGFAHVWQRDDNAWRPDACVSLSSVAPGGLRPLEEAVAEIFPAGDPGDAGSLLTDQRQEDAARRALDAVERAKAALDAGITPDAVLTDAEEALDALGELTGRTAKEEIVSRIFSRFCVGK